MDAPDEVIEMMTQAAITDAFRQKGLSEEQKLAFDAAGQTYRFMGVDLKESMRAAVAELDKNGWRLSRTDTQAGGE